MSERERLGSTWTALSQMEKSREGIPIRGPELAKVGGRSK